ncbi:MAG: transglutaminase-like domain-containing protein [Bacteroidia bacterium]|nr:transglutaminase-like domain-containing protein [Bacteroidia bacterium]MDW8089627.1 transglutaminase family protein [Bacteroidia bacterium]
MESAQLKALFRLLDDPDPAVQAHIEKVFIEMGREAIPLLEQQWLETQDPIAQKRLEELLEAVQLEVVGQALYAWRMEPQQPLLPALMYVAQLRYASLDVAKYTNAYRRLVHTTWLNLPSHGDPLERFLAINRQIFLHERFQPERTRPQASRYFFLHEVLDTRRGNSFSLSVLYYLLASELGLEVGLITIGERYLIRYFDGTLHFYIEPYYRGFILLPDQLKDILRRAGLSDNLAHYRALSPPYLILRLIQHLEEAYMQEGEVGWSQLYAKLRARIEPQREGGGTM